MKNFWLKVMALVFWPVLMLVLAFFVALLMFGGWIAILIGTPYRNEKGEWTVRMPWEPNPQKDARHE